MARTVTPKLQIKKCTANLKTDEGKIIPCNGLVHGGRCTKKDEHMLPYPTGYCQLGRCEGKKIRGARSEAPQPTCKWWKRCPCSCHELLDQMFILSEQPRQLVDNSGYSVDRGGFVMPTLEERMRLHAALYSPTPTDGPRYVESVAPDVIPARVERVFTPPPSGRSARGELESYARRVCDDWAVDKDFYRGVECTPRLISEEIAKNEGIKAPSTGAITAVLERWEKVGFAKLDRKPIRFIGYTEDGIKLGLEELQSRARRHQRSKNISLGRSK